MRRILTIGLALLLVLGGCSDDGADTTSVTTSAPESSTSTPPTTTAPLPEAVAGLVGLGFEEFVDGSFDALLLRTPQFITELGLSEEYGIRNDSLDDLSDEYKAETREMEAALLSMLGAYDRETLAPEQQVTFDVYRWYLDDRVRGHEFAYHDYPVHHMLGSYHWNTFFYFTDSFPLNSQEDAEDYVTAMESVGTQATQVLEGLRLRQEMGIYPPDFIVAMAREAMLGQLGVGAPTYDRIEPTRLDVYTRFEEDTADLAIDEDVRTAMLADLEAAIEASLVPAWAEIISHLLELRDTAGSDAGLWKLPDGDAYYAYMVRQETSSDLTPDEIHELGLREVDRVRDELTALFGDLGYPEGEPVGFSMNRVAVEGGSVAASAGDPDAVITAFQEYLDRIEPRLDAVFGQLPAGVMEIRPDPSGGGGGYYSPGTFDGSRPGVFYAGSGGAVPRYSMPTLLHHEGMPGHHLQLTLAGELGLPLMRSAVHYNGYVEGWALYAEYLAKELGVYDDDPYGDAGRLHLELLRAVRLVVDTGVHAKRWTREEARRYINDTLGSFTWEVDRYIVLPGQALGYKIGMIEILRLRDMAETELGDAFDLAAFHDVVLGNGSLPLEILDRLVDDWLADQG